MSYPPPRRASGPQPAAEVGRHDGVTRLPMAWAKKLSSMGDARLASTAEAIFLRLCEGEAPEQENAKGLAGFSHAEARLTCPGGPRNRGHPGVCRVRDELITYCNRVSMYVLRGGVFGGLVQVD